MQSSLFTSPPQETQAVTLYPFQEEAVVRVFDRFEKLRSTLLVMPTGTGKTLTFAAVARRWRDEQKNPKVLVLAHRTELLEQAEKKITATVGLSCGIEQQDRSVLNGWELPDVTIASVPSMNKKRLAQFPVDSFGLIITDEAHHATSPTYRAIYERFSAAKHLGVTATPDRLDKKALGAIFDSVAFTYEIRDAIENGFLVRIFQRKVTVDGLDFSHLQTKKGDFSDEELESLLIEKETLYKMAHPTFDLAGDRPTIVFCTTVKHSQMMSQVLNEYGQEHYQRDISAPVWGDMSSTLRKTTLQNFEKGRIQFLVNCAVLTEGVDIPKISCVSMCRPTKSRALYSQMVGRGTRLYPGKYGLLVLDFAGHSGQHSLISTVDILDGNMDLTVKARAEKKTKAHPDLDILEALKQAQEEIAAEEKNFFLAARSIFRTNDVDPLQAIGIHPCAGRWGGEPVTPEQREILEQNKLPLNVDRGQAEEIIAEVKRRQSLGLPTPRQARQLLRFSIEPDVPKVIASKIMTAIQNEEWNPTNATLEYCRALAAEHHINRPVTA